MKRIISITLAIVILFCFVPVYADSVVDKAEVLYNLGLLKGVGSGFSVEGLELARGAKRVEICVTVVRMLGKEEKAMYQNNAHPFSDVPAWAGAYVGWLYENYLVNGVNENYFGSDSLATTKQFCAMILRVLGYSEGEGHFKYDDAVKVALEKKIITQKMAYQDTLTRENMVHICYNALKANLRNSKRTLITKLCDDGAVDKTVAEKSGILKKESISDAFPNVPETLGKITAYKGEGHVKLVFDTPAEEYGLRVYIMGEDGILKALSNYGTPFFRKGKIFYPGGSAAGYVDEIMVYNVEDNKYSFIVIKTTSEGELFDIVGKSSPASN